MTARAAWIRWLQLEDEACWTYPVIGARVHSLTAAAQASLDRHDAVRSALLHHFEREGWTAPATPAAYDIGEVKNAASAKAVAQSIENAITAALVVLVGATTGSDRAYAVAALRNSSVDAVGWGARVSGLPGLRGS